MKAKLLLITLLLLIVVSCKQNKATNDTEDLSEISDCLGKYLYLANSGVIHSSKSCYKIILEKDENGHNVVGYQFIDTMTVHDLNCLYCPECFNDAKYDHFKRIQQRNSNINKLYESLDAGGADVGESFEEFAHKFYTKGSDGSLGSKKIYDFLKEEEAISSPDYETFMRKLEETNSDLPEI